MPIKLTPEIISAAIKGYESQRADLDAKIAELRAMLSGAPSKASAAPVASAPAPAPNGRKTRRLSAAGRKAIADAARKRWADFHAAKKA